MAASSFVRTRSITIHPAGDVTHFNIEFVCSPSGRYQVPRTELRLDVKETRLIRTTPHLEPDRDQSWHLGIFAMNKGYPNPWSCSVLGYLPSMFPMSSRKEVLAVVANALPAFGYHCT